MTKTCAYCKHWKTRWAAGPGRKKERGGCAMTRKSDRLTILDNTARQATYGWLETPFDFGCNLWAEKPTPKHVSVDKC